MKLSVIVPVYNTSIYLEKCLDSLFSQDYSDMEIICVNDCSNDSSFEILQKYKDKIKIINNKENLGSGVSRNCALEIAKGEYILFVDSDDWLVFGAINKIINEAEKFKTDILIFGGLTVSDGKIRKGSYSVNKIPNKYKNGIFSLSKAEKNIFSFPSTAWTKLYKREFLLKNGIKFQEVKRGQDQIFFVASMLKAEKIKVLEENLYCYLKNRKGSSTSDKKRRDFCAIEIFYEIEKFLEKNNFNKQVFIKKYFSKAVSYLSKTDETFKGEYYTELQKLLDYIKNKYGFYKKFHPKISDSYLMLKIKLMCSTIF